MKKNLLNYYFYYTLRFTISILLFTYSIKSYAQLYTNDSFNAKTINASLAVGSTAGAGGVASGAATYSIPIAVPPGTNGVVPSISIVYNSQGGNGTLGKGWSLSGLSMISRSNKTIFFDNEVNGVVLSNNDRYALDGARLIGTSGSYGTNDATYKTESENFATITSYTDPSKNGITWFKVISKDGSVMEYGRTEDSRKTSDAGNYVLFWRLNKIQYSDGNYINFVYDNSGSESRIVEIAYTGNAITARAPYNKIVFSYTERIQDKTTYYEAGTALRLNYLLDKITITSGAETTKSYQFVYASDYVNTYLKEVQEAGSDGSQLNATIFKYGDIPTPFSETTITRNEAEIINNPARWDYFSGDVNGDGISDIISGKYSKVGPYKYYSEISIRRRQSPSAINFNQTSRIGLPANTWLVSYMMGPNANALVNDYTGDGKDDILTVTTDASDASGTNRIVKWISLYEIWPKANASQDSLSGRDLYNTYEHINKVHPSGKFIFPGDFNGDGTYDVLTILGNSSNAYSSFLYFGNPAAPKAGYGSNNLPNLSFHSTGFQLVGLSGTYQFTINQWPTMDHIQVLDFNGDGKSDLMLIKDNTCEILTFDGYGARPIYFGTNKFSKDNLIYVGDFNGDGKTDLLVRSQKAGITSAWTKFISTGTDFIASSFSFQKNPNITDANEIDKVVLADYNGDGRTDIFHGWNSGTNATLDVYYSKGDTFLQQQYTYTDNFTASAGSMQPFDLNGDGKADLLNQSFTSSTINDIDILYFNKEGKEHLLERVKNGFGHVSQWKYNNLTTGGNFYKRGELIPFTGFLRYGESPRISPRYLNNLQPALYAVAEFKAQNGVGGEAITQYNYEEAKFHRAGKGFLGFKKITASDLAMDVRSISESVLDTTFYALTPSLESRFLLSKNEQLQQTTTQGEFLNLGNKRFLYRVKSTSLNNLFEGRTVTTTNTYDNFGNVLTNRVQNGNLETTITTAAYGAFGPSTIPSKTTFTQIAKTRSGQDAFTTSSRFQYNADKGQLTAKIDFSGQADSVTTRYEYYPDGTLKQTKVTPTGLPDREVTTSLTYDDKGRFAETATNPLGQTVTTNYDAKWGKPKKVTGIDGLVTEFEYDAFGRTSKTKMPEGYWINQSYHWDLSNAVNRAIYYTHIEHPGKPDTKTYLDVIGRELRSETEGMLGSWIVEDQGYDSKGNIETTTQPYLKGIETILTTTSQYDEYNRLKKTENSAFGATILNYTYANGNLTTTSTDPKGQQSSKVTDASGQVVSATDQGGTLTYTYYSHGKVRDIIRDNKALTHSEYDAYGRQSKLTDQNAGTSTYTYYATGDLKTQTNANGKTSTLFYDKLGRQTSRTSEEGTTIYEYYGSQGASTNQLKKTTGFTSGNFTNYTYNSYGRLETVTETIDASTSQTTTFGYNAYGDITSKIYSSGFGVKQNYDGNGYLTSITNSSGNVTLYTTGSLNGLGQVKTYSLGNGKASTNSYYFGMPTNYLTPGIQNLTLDWDYRSGNLNFRRDDMKSKQENFTYDNLNRLETSKVGSQDAITIRYTSSGNIDFKTDAGNYQYLTAKPNAVEYVSNEKGAIPDFKQDIVYTPFLRAKEIKENSTIITYSYGSDYERIKAELIQNGTQKYTRYYFGELDKNNQQYIHYVASPVGLIALVVRENGNDAYHYVYTDHLGSILTVTNASGSVEVEQNFDAWGRRRNPVSWEYTTNIPTRPDWLYRGYTGHEHLDEFSLINMNARLYDPLVGRMLSPDNEISDVYSSQGYNRYSYALNNPLAYVDPDGNTIIPFLIGLGKAVATGAAISSTVYSVNTFLTGQSFSWQSFGQAALKGAVSGGISFGIGSGIEGIFGNQTSFLSEATRAAAHGLASKLQGGNFASGAFGSAFGSVADQLDLGPVEQVIAGGIGGGLGSLIEGGNFVDGFRTGMITTATNHLMHQVENAIDPPGTLEGLIPIWGSGKQSYYEIQQGNYGWAAFHGALAVSDVFLVKSIAQGVGKGVWKLAKGIDPFSLRNGYGVFGKKGLKVGNYKIEALYGNKGAGGTIFSLKQMKQGGAVWRWDYGLLHQSGKMGLHSTVRFHWNGVKYGSTAQRTWYPSMWAAPFFRPL